jgi:hypothetical protein
MSCSSCVISRVGTLATKQSSSHDAAKKGSDSRAALEHVTRALLRPNVSFTPTPLFLRQRLQLLAKRGRAEEVG